MRHWSSRPLAQLFHTYLTSYLSGLLSIESFQHVADELLYESFQKDVPLSPLLFAALKCASDPPSTPKELIAWHQKLKNYGEKLRSYEKEGTEPAYMES